MKFYILLNVYNDTCLKEEVEILYYFILVLGILFVTGATGYFIYTYINKEFVLFDVVKAIGIFLLGTLLLMMTLPILKSMLLKEYDVFQGECRVEIAPFGRGTEAIFNMVDIGEQFTFSDISELNAYGKSVPYYCEVTVSKDHLYGIDYKIFDAESHELLIKTK